MKRRVGSQPGHRMPNYIPTFEKRTLPCGEKSWVIVFHKPEKLGMEER